jgi:hypothetical protein
MTLVSLGCASMLAAQQSDTAARVTEPGRSIDRPLDLFLAGRTNKPVKRTLMILVDPSEGLSSAGFADAFAKAIAANQAVLAQTEIGLAVLGAKDPVVVAPTLQHQTVVAAVRTHTTRGVGALRNVYEGVREVAATMTRGTGERALLLVSFENGDLEDDVEKTVQQLRKAKIRVEVLASETTLADSYWQRNPNQQKPSKTELVGGDAAIVDVPWGFLFQYEPANEVTPSGYAMWGFNRLAAATDGRVFLYASSEQVAHTCAFSGSCLFCNGDHELPDAAWNSALVSQAAPLTAARKDALKEMGKDACFRLVMKIWHEAAEEGLVASAPAVRVQATSAAPDRARKGRDLRLLLAGNFARNAKRAQEAAVEAAHLRDRLAEAIKNLPAEGISHRARASAEYTLVLLQLTRVNLLTFVGFCSDYAPRWLDQRGDAPLLPEQVPFDFDGRPDAIYFTNLSLCHGVRPFYEVELPGDDEFQQELRKLDAMFNGFQLRYGKGPFGYALRRNGIARFYPVFYGVQKGPVRRRPKSQNQPKGPITPKRPPRRGGGSGPAGGPTTGGGK